MNDWEIKKFLTIALAIQLTLWGLIGLDAIGLQIPILRQLIGFIYLTFIPGILILRILKLHKLRAIETLLYAVGLSISFLFILGLFMNAIFPFIGISKPISELPLVVTISIAVIFLCVLCYSRDKNFSAPSFVDKKSFSQLTSPYGFLLLIPFLCIFGTYLMNFYNSNILLFVLLLILSFMPILVAYNKFPKALYPLAVFIISISLLYHRSLISMYLWGWDIQIEYYFSNLVFNNGFWDWTIPHIYNGVIGANMLSPIYSIFCNLNLIWVFKIFYPLLFSLVPVGLYHIFQSQTDDKIAFLSCFYFMSTAGFYNEMLHLAKQQVAELFLVLLILLMIDKNMAEVKRSFLFIIFGFSLVVSHYGASYIYMLCLISAWLILVLTKNPKIQELRESVHSKFGRYRNKFTFTTNPLFSNAEDRTITSTFVLLFTLFAIGWYIYVSSGSPFNTIVHTGNHIANSIFTEFLSPESTELGSIISKTTPTRTITKAMVLITQFFIAVGIFDLLLGLRKTEFKFSKEYAAFSMVAFVLCLTAIAIPHFAAMHGTRLFHITLFFLAPFCIIGAITFFEVLDRMLKLLWINKDKVLKFLSLFLMVFLLFNCGFVFEIAKDNPTSISLNNSVNHPKFNQKEVLGAEWAKEFAVESTIYADDFGGLLLCEFFSPMERRIKIFKGDTEKLQENSYIYFRSVNVNDEMIEDRWIMGHPKLFAYSLSNTMFYKKVIVSANKIYDNGGSVIYW